MTGENNDTEPEFQEEIGSDLDLEGDNQFSESEDEDNRQEKLKELSERFKSKMSDILHSKRDSSKEIDDEVEMVDEVSEIYQDIERVREDLENKIETKTAMLNEEVEEVEGDSDKNVSQVREELNQKIEDVEKDIKRDINSLDEEIKSIESEIENLVEAINSKVDKSRHEEIDELEGLGERVARIEEELDTKADNSDIEDMQEVQNLLTERLDEKINKYDIEGNTEKMREDLGVLKKEVEKLAAGDSSEPIKPSEITENLEGNYVEVRGDVTFKKELADEYLYTLNGSKDNIAVRSKNKIEEGERTVDGTVKNLEGFLFLHSI